MIPGDNEACIRLGNPAIYYTGDDNCIYRLDLDPVAGQRFPDPRQRGLASALVNYVAAKLETESR